MAQHLVNKRNCEHLIWQIRNQNNDVPNFALFLGAGASVTSGVKTAKEMIADWRQELHKRSKSQVPLADWVQQQAYCGDDDEYSFLFELMHDQPVQRRIFIEECVKQAHPNWGYVYLTNLLAHRIFNVVFTTNFEDLINEACFLYSEGLRPMVSAHDSAVTSMRVTSDRPKIMKLHGDFLYDNIKNTMRELEALEENTRNKLRQFAQEYGLVVVGYGGRDRSVMDTLDVLLKDGDYFPHGVYWCIRRDDAPGKRLQYLLRRERIYLVEIEGFDEFMAEIHEAAALNLPDPIAHPFSVARDRARLFVDDNSGLRRNSVIDKDIRSIRDELQRYPEEVFAQRDHRIGAATAMLMATIAHDKGHLEFARSLAKRAVDADPSDPHSAYIYATVLADLGNYGLLKTFVEESPLAMARKIYFLLRTGENDEVIRMAEEVLEADPSDWRSRINRAIALKRKGSSQEFERDMAVLEEIKPDENKMWDLAAGVAALRHQKVDMLRYIELAHKNSQLTASSLKVFPVFEDFREDEDFQTLLSDLQNPSSRPNGST